LAKGEDSLHLVSPCTDHESQTLREASTPPPRLKHLGLAMLIGVSIGVAGTLICVSALNDGGTHFKPAMNLEEQCESVRYARYDRDNCFRGWIFGMTQTVTGCRQQVTGFRLSATTDLACQADGLGILPRTRLGFGIRLRTC